MPRIKGQKEYEKFKKGVPLTRREAILAQCYACSAGVRADCENEECALYAFHPYRKNKSKRPMSKKHKKQVETLNRGR